MAEVYRFVQPDGQTHAWHGTVSDLRKAHPNAAVTGRLVSDDLGQGTWQPYSGNQAAADERKAEATAAKPKAVTSAAPAKVDMAVLEQPAKKDAT